MYIFGKRADQLVESDIQRLLSNQVKENKSLDYKRDLKLTEGKDRKEFLFDISSMFNTDGGCLIYGIEESKDDQGQNSGIPRGIIGLKIDNWDKTYQQIEDLIKSNTEPSITGILLSHLVVEQKDILIIGIAKNISLPAMVTYNETNKFYRRRNSGKYAVDVYELNQMFMHHQLFKKNVEDFRIDRVHKVRNLKVFPNLETFASFFIQIIPYSFQNETILDLSKAKHMDLSGMMRPIDAHGWDQMHNLDGFANFSLSNSTPRKIIAYDQLFRNGIYEAYTTDLFESMEINNQKFTGIFGSELTLLVMNKIKDALRVLGIFEIEPPFAVCISLHGIANGVIGNQRGSYTLSNRILIDEIFLPTIMLPSFETDIYPRLKPIFDIIWQSAGYVKSPDLDIKRG